MQTFIVRAVCMAVMGVSGAFSCMAQEQEQRLLNLQAEARVDYQREYIGGDAVKSNSGFKGRYVNLIASGDIGGSFSYAYRQRLVKANENQSFFDSVDFIYLTWHATPRWDFSAGKQIVWIGGYEYDRAPIDLYFCSEFWNNIPCYQLGVSAAYAVSGKDKLTAQVCQSPFRANGDDMYAYNIMWNGQHGCLSTIYSLNMAEYCPGRYISYISLGHRLAVGKLAVELDFMNRAASHQAYFLKDCSVMGELSYRPSEQWNVFCKAAYDVNSTGTRADDTVLPGTELTSVGGGVELYPLKGSRNIRVHAFYAHSFGRNGNTEGGVVQPQQDVLNVGLKWKVDLLALKDKLTKH